MIDIIGCGLSDRCDEDQVEFFDQMYMGIFEHFRNNIMIVAHSYGAYLVSMFCIRNKSFMERFDIKDIILLSPIGMTR